MVLQFLQINKYIFNAFFEILKIVKKILKIGLLKHCDKLTRKINNNKQTSNETNKVRGTVFFPVEIYFREPGAFFQDKN